MPQSGFWDAPPSPGETHPTATGSTDAEDPQPDLERSRVTPGCSHFQEVAEAGIRVSTAFPQSGFGASSSPGRGPCLTCLPACVVAQLLPLGPALFTSS